ncbi:uncharacterized protein LOC106467132 isoform X4 [Limulus polyphemus]|uniref:Uncharacterized protein LOC106467132 isoform X4 n=1 Tax=Limulus polyphemus TaxID=6850 RepID=A0ABM1BIY0_LIMPO|nr:uncharacterized protein LOC106467132 isoform X4 [Limulus polyphemus]
MHHTNTGTYRSFLTSLSKLKAGKKSKNTKTQEIEIRTEDAESVKDEKTTGKRHLPSLLERAVKFEEREDKQPVQCDSEISSNVKKEKKVLFKMDGTVPPKCSNIFTSNNVIITSREEEEEVNNLTQQNPIQKLNSRYSCPPAVPLKISSAQPSKVSDKNTNEKKSVNSFDSNVTPNSIVENTKQTQNSTSSKVENSEKVNSHGPKDCSSEDAYIWKDMTFLFADLAFRTHWLLREITKHLERQNDLLRNELKKARLENTKEHCYVDSHKLDMLECRLKTLEKLIESQGKPKIHCLKISEAKTKGDSNFNASSVSTAQKHYAPSCKEEKLALLKLVIDGLIPRMQRLEEWHRNSSLVFYGVSGDSEETPTSSADRVAQVLKKALGLQK